MLRTIKDGDTLAKQMRRTLQIRSQHVKNLEYSRREAMDDNYKSGHDDVSKDYLRALICRIHDRLQYHSDGSWDDGDPVWDKMRKLVMGDIS